MLFQSETDPKLSEVLDFSDNTQEGSNISDLRTDPTSVSNCSIMLLLQILFLLQDWLESGSATGTHDGRDDVDVNDENSSEATPDAEAGDSRLHPSRRGLEPARNIAILPHLPKFAIVVARDPQQGLG